MSRPTSSYYLGAAGEGRRGNGNTAELPDGPDRFLSAQTHTSSTRNQRPRTLPDPEQIAEPKPEVQKKQQRTESQLLTPERNLRGTSEEPLRGSTMDQNKNI